MTRDDEIREAAIGAVEVEKFEPTEEEIAAALAEMEPLMADHADRSGE